MIDINEIQITDYIIGNWVIGVCFLIFGLYLWEKSYKSSSGRLFSVTIFFTSIIILIGSIVTSPISDSLFIFIGKTATTLTLFVIVTLYAGSITLLEQYQKTNASFQRVFLWTVVVPINTLFSLAILFLEYFILSVPSVMTDNPDSSRDIEITSNYIYITIFKCIIATIIMYNFYLSWRKSPKDKFSKKRSLLLLISSFISGTAIYIMAYGNHLIHIKQIEWSASIINFYNLLFLISIAILMYAVVRYEAFSRKGVKRLNDLIATICTSIFWITLYSFCFILILKKFNTIDSTYISATLILVLPIITVHSNKYLKRVIKRLLSRRTDTLNMITLEEVGFVIRNIHVPKRLMKSGLVSLAAVKNLSNEQDIPILEALSMLLQNITKELRPKDRSKKRTIIRLKYEMLRMILNEAAVESSILWNLGYDSGVKIKTEMRPTYPVQDNSEYKATSINSYRRLRKELLEQIKWKLIQCEKKALLK
jgi:hypothetical protein